MKLSTITWNIILLFVGICVDSSLTECSYRYIASRAAGLAAGYQLLHGHTYHGCVVQKDHQLNKVHNQDILKYYHNDKMHVHAVKSNEGQNVSLLSVLEHNEFFDVIDYKVYYPGTSKIKFSDIIGHNQVKKMLQQYVEYYQNLQISYVDWLFGKAKENIIHPGNRIIISGPSGCGKTLMMQALSGELSCPVITVPHGLFHLKQSDQKIDEFIAKAKQLAPCVICIDDFNRVVVKNGGNKDDIAHVDNFLMKLKDLESTHPSITVIGVVQEFANLENKITETYNFSQDIRLNLPDEQERVLLLTKLLHNKQLSKDVKLRLIARILTAEGRPSYRDILVFVSVLNQIVYQQEKDYVDMQVVEQAFDLLIYGGYWEPHKDNNIERTVAHHEAGHALLITSSSNRILYRANILFKGSTLGFVEHHKIHEQQKDSLQDLDHQLAILFAGGVAEQFLEGKRFASLDDGLNDFFDRISVKSDADQIMYFTRERILLHRNLQNLDNKHSADGYDKEIIKNEACQVVEEAYIKAIEEIGKNQAIHAAIVATLIKDKVVSGKKIYEICGKEQPKYDFEQ